MVFTTLTSFGQHSSINELKVIAHLVIRLINFEIPPTAESLLAMEILCFQKKPTCPNEYQEGSRTF